MYRYANNKGQGLISSIKFYQLQINFRMKQCVLTLLLCLLGGVPSFAQQWENIGKDIANTNTGKVIINSAYQQLLVDFFDAVFDFQV